MGFVFGGDTKTFWLDKEKSCVLLTRTKMWLWESKGMQHNIPFKEFESIVSKLRHAFISVPAGNGLLLPLNAVLRRAQGVVYLDRHPEAT